MRFKKIALVLAGIALSAGSGCSNQAAQSGASQAPAAAAALRKLADQYFDQVYFHYDPSSGTEAGLHQYDAQLEDYSRDAVDRETADLHSPMLYTSRKRLQKLTVACVAQSYGLTCFQKELHMPLNIASRFFHYVPQMHISDRDS